MKSIPFVQNPIKVLIVGGSYGGLSAAAKLVNLCSGLIAKSPPIDIQLSIVDERDGFFHKVGAPRAFTDLEYAGKSWVKFNNIPALQAPNVEFIQGTVSTIDLDNCQANIMESTTEKAQVLSYDFLVAATGLRKVSPVIPKATVYENFLTETESFSKEVQSATGGVIVVGGGAVGIEMAAKLKMAIPSMKVTLVHSRDTLLSSEPLPKEMGSVTLNLLERAGVEVLTDHRLSSVTKLGTVCDFKYKAQFTNGRVIETDRVFTTVTKSSPSTSYLPISVLDDEGYVKATNSLNFTSDSPNSGHHFCAGDICNRSGIKLAGAAIAHGQLVAHNIHQAILHRAASKSPEFVLLEDMPPMMALSIGKEAVSYAPWSGVESGADVARFFFGGDMAFAECWNRMQLGGRS